MRAGKTRSDTAVTLIELMMAMGCGSIIFAALLIAGVALQRSLTAIEAYSMAQGDQLRVQDYIAMDCRRATNVTIDRGTWANSGGAWSWAADPNGIQTLIITVPSYYDSTTKQPVAPAFDANGKIQYNNGATTTISYYQNGSDFIRQVGSNPNAAKPLGSRAIATNVAGFTITPFDQSATNGTVSCSITFSPRFISSPGPIPISATRVFSQTFLRNAQARQ